MNPEPITHAQCEDAASRFEEAMKLIGDFWTLRIVGAIREDELRFCEIERTLPDINPATLTSRLKRLEEEGILLRHLGTRDKQSVTYALSPKGQAVLPILESIKQFTDTFSS